MSAGTLAVKASRPAKGGVRLREWGRTGPPFWYGSINHGPKVPPFLAEPGQIPHITMWHYGCGRLLRCGCAGSMRREGYGGCAGAVVLGHGRSAPLNTAVECSSSPQHRGSKATCRPPSPRRSEKIPKVRSHREGVKALIIRFWLYLLLAELIASNSRANIVSGRK